MGRLDRLASGMLEAGWLTTVVLTPLFIDKNGGDVFEGAKVGLLRALALLMLAAWATRAVASPDAAPAWRSAVRMPLVGAVVALVLVHALSTLLSLAPAESLWGHHGRVQGLLTLCANVAIFAATLANLKTRAQLRRLVTALILPTIPIAAYAIAQRFRVEPLYIAMRETDVERATSLLGQPVFLAAYLAMVMPFTVMRVHELARASARSDGRRRLALGVYGLVLVMQVIATLITESRGPMLGAFVGVSMAALVIAARHGHRRLLIGVAVCAAVGVVAVTVVAPALRASPSTSPEVRRVAARVSDLFAVRGSGGQFRNTTWNVAVRVLKNDAPIELADGSHDARPGLRRLIGFGPETQYIVSPPFYDDELPRLFGYFLADRYHNDLWDALITTGILGLAAALALQSTLLWSLFQGLRLTNVGGARGFWGALAGGAVVGGLGWSAAHGWAFVFLGVQLGALAGLAVLLMAGGVLRGARVGGDAVIEHEPLLLAVLAAVVGHLVEVSFSFTVVTTGALFWVLCALTLALPRLAPEPQPERGSQAASIADPSAWRDPIASGALLALVTMTLGFVFLGGFKLAPKPGDLLWDGLTLLSEPRGKRAPVVAILVTFSWLMGGLVLALAPRGERQPALFGRRLRWSLGISAVVGLAYWMRLSTLLARRGAISMIPGLHAEDNIVLREAAITSFYVWAALLVLLAALHLGDSTNVARGVNTRWWRVAAAACCVMVAFALVEPCTLRPAVAEAASALGTALKDQRKFALAEEAYTRAAQLRPHSDVYAASLGKTYHRHARADRARAHALYQLANQSLLEAIARNPAASENATNLAITRSNWANLTKSPALRGSVPELFARALRLNPRDPHVWQGWATAQMGLFGDSHGALQSAQRALALDESSEAAKVLVAEIQTAIASRGGAQDRLNDIEHVRR